MILSFELSMPSNNSWNGKWTGEKNLYVLTRKFSTKKSKENAHNILSEGYFAYSFGDGWMAGIDVKEVSQKEAVALRKKSSGFCGYDWMVDSIYEFGEILNQEQRIEKRRILKLELEG